MISIKRMGLKLFSLCVLALGLVAFSATAAQAEGTWMVAGADLTSGKAVTGKIVNLEGALLAVLGINNITFTCTTATLVNASLEKEGAVSEASKNAKVKFSGCTTTINGTLTKACEPVNGAEKGVIVTEEGFALFKEHSTGEGFVEIIPKIGTVFAVIHLGEACAIGEEVKVFGKLAVKDSEGEVGLETEKVIHTIEEFKALSELKIANAKSEGKAILDGKAEGELTSGVAWNALRPNRRLILSTGETNKNPFTLEAEVTSTSDSKNCPVGTKRASLLTCVNSGMWAIWKAL
jgi:hypothetical protein